MEHQASHKADTPTACCPKPAPKTTEPIGLFHDLHQQLGNRALGREIQAKLNVSEPHDPHEQEADRVAAELMRMPATSGAAVAPGANLQSIVSSGSGQSLPESTRAFFEPRFGHDFSNVQVHTDARATASAQQLDARAYTVGRDIVFGAGQYSPDTHAGKQLLAHELAHVAQNHRDDGIHSGRIQRQPTPVPNEDPVTSALKLVPNLAPLKPPGAPTVDFIELLKVPGDPFLLFGDLLGDLFWNRPAGKEMEPFKLKGYESAGLFTLEYGSLLGLSGLGGEKYKPGASFGSNYQVWKKYVQATQPLTPSDDALMDSLSSMLRLRLDKYLASDLFVSRLKSHPLGTLALLGAAEAIYYTATGGPGEAGKLSTTPDWNRATGFPTLLLGAAFSEYLKPPQFFNLMPLVMKTHPAFAYTPFAGEAPPTELAAEGALGSGEGEGGESYKFATSINLSKLLLVPKGLEAKDLDNLSKYRGFQSSVWISFDSLDPTKTMESLGRLAESKLKGGMLFGHKGYMTMLEVGATYDQPLAKDLTSWFIKGGFGYSGSAKKFADRIGFRATLNEGDTMAPANEIFLQGLGLTATVMGYKPEYNLAPTGPGGAPVGGWAARFTPFFSLDLISRKSKFSFGTALSFVTGSDEDFGVSDFRGDISYTYLGDSSEEKLPRFKATISFSGNRLDWWNKNAPWMYGVQSRLQGGPLFGGVQVMSGAADIPESRAAQFDKPETVKKNTAVLFVTGALF